MDYLGLKSIVQVFLFVTKLIFDHGTEKQEQSQQQQQQQQQHQEKQKTNKMGLSPARPSKKKKWAAQLV